MEHFQYRRIQFNLGPIDAALVPAIHVTLEIRDAENPSVPPVQASIDLTSQNPQQTWRLRQTLDSDAVRIFATQPGKTRGAQCTRWTIGPKSPGTPSQPWVPIRMC